MNAEQFFDNGFGADVEKVHRRHVIQSMANFAKHYHEQKLKLVGRADEGRREEYHCELYEFGRCESPCAKQCESCFWMESKR